MIYESAQDRYQDYEKNKKEISPFRMGEIAPYVDENLNYLVIFAGEDISKYRIDFKHINVCQPISLGMVTTSFWRELAGPMLFWGRLVICKWSYTTLYSMLNRHQS